MDNIQDAYGVPNLYHKSYKQLIISSGQIRGGEVKLHRYLVYNNKAERNDLIAFRFLVFMRYDVQGMPEIRIFAESLIINL